MATGKQMMKNGEKERAKAVEIELLISCENLRDMPGASSRNTPVVCSLLQYNRTNSTKVADEAASEAAKSSPTTDEAGDEPPALDEKKMWSEKGNLEMIDEAKHVKFTVEYQFEELQRYRVKLYSDKNSEEGLIGKAEFTLANVVTARERFSKELTSPSYDGHCGKVHIKGKEVQQEYMITMSLRCTGLHSKNISGTVKPFIEISKTPEGDDHKDLVYRSKAMVGTLNPKWAQFQIPDQPLCDRDWSRPLYFRVLSHNKPKHDFIGMADCTLKELTEETEKVTQLEIIHDGLKAKRFTRYRNSGILHFDTVQATPISSFMDYIKDGWSISLIIAIDFTESNIECTNPASLHYTDKISRPSNQYIEAITSVGSVLADYSSDQRFPVFGFGAKIRHQDVTQQHEDVSHCFPLNFNYEHPEENGIREIVERYKHALGQVDLSGPTNFSGVIEKAMWYAKEGVSQKKQRYYILLIITDGIISDMERSIDCIVEASKCPLSIVIVGVGKADFNDMHRLDADVKPLKDSKDTKMSRDIIQFVPFMEHRNSDDNSSLARETMAEIPRQFISYMESEDGKKALASATSTQTEMPHGDVSSETSSNLETSTSQVKIEEKHVHFQSSQPSA